MGNTGFMGGSALIQTVGGVRRPPAVFNIGGERGFLFYSGPPIYCRNCCVYGHTSGDCDQRAKCRFCGNVDHSSRECIQRKVCDICKKVRHLTRQRKEYFAAKRETEFHEMITKKACKTAKASYGVTGGRFN